MTVLSAPGELGATLGPNDGVQFLGGYGMYQGIYNIEERKSGKKLNIYCSSYFAFTPN